MQQGVENMQEYRKESQGPIAKFRAGGIHVAIWANAGKDGLSYQTVSIDKNYKVGDEWRTTKSFRANELPKVILALQKAYEYLALKEQPEGQYVSSRSNSVPGEGLVKLIA